MSETASQWRRHGVTFRVDGDFPWFVVAPWSGHRSFASDLVANLRPARIVELGTHFGVSMSAFAEGAHRFSRSTELIAVDTWRGDEHAGFYDQSVKNVFDQMIAQHFDELDIRVLQMTFDEALKIVENSSVDIVHIDGLHTYEATRHDFESWLPKLRPGGLMLLHDVSPESGYGSARFWSELESSMKVVMFRHSFGLGVVAPRGPHPLIDMLSDSEGLLRDSYELLGTRNLFERQVKDLEAMVRDRDEALRTIEAMVRDRDEALQAVEAMVRDRDEALQAVEAMVRDRNHYIIELELRVQQLLLESGPGSGTADSKDGSEARVAPVNE